MGRVSQIVLRNQTKKVHRGSQPSLRFQTSKFSGGIVAITLVLWASYFCFIKISEALIASMIFLTDQLFITTAGSENLVSTLSSRKIIKECSYYS